MRAIGYVRVSTQGQVEEGVSLAAQEAKIRAWAESNGAAEVLVFRDEGISGKRTKNRPGLADALDAAGKGDALVCYSMSRLSRSTRDMLDIAEVLRKHGAELVSLSENIDTTSAAGKMVFQVLAVLAEFERNQISERTRASLQYKKHRGEKLGGAHCPFGYEDNDGKLIPVPEEQKVIKQVRLWHRQEWSLREIARKLEAKHVPRKAGGDKWYAVNVQRVIQHVAQ